MMTKATASVESNCPKQKRRHHKLQGLRTDQIKAGRNFPGVDFKVGRHLRELRAKRGLSIRNLAKLSGLNVNTLSMIENSRTSPSVSTLQQLASALDVPITVFFKTDIPKTNVSYQKVSQRLRATFAHGTLEDLGAGLTLWGGQPFLVTLKPKANSGSIPFVHTGLELVFCLDGHLSYTIEEHIYPLDPGDSLLFEAYLPHCWQNTGDIASRSLLILCPTDKSDRPIERYFKQE
jgi:transcriptional regulator with XRE-family HTH domain